MTTSQINVTAGSLRKLTSGTSAGRFQATIVLGEGRGAAKRTKTFDTRREALAWQHQAKRNGVAHGEASTRTVAEAVDVYVASKVLAPNTVEVFTATRGHLVASGLGDVRLAKLKASDQDRFTTWLVRHGFAAPTVNLYAVKLNAVLRFADRDGGLSFRPKAAKVVHVNADDSVSLAPGDVAALYDAAPDTFAPAILLGAFAGLRASEAAAVNVGDVDWSAGTLRVSKAVDADGRFTTTKTARSVRTIPLPPNVLDQLSAHRFRGDDAPLATNMEGGRMAPRTVARTFRIVADASGLDQSTFHALRKFFATTLLARGVNPKAVAKYLGDSVATMLSTYALVLPTDADQARSVLSDVFAATAAA